MASSHAIVATIFCFLVLASSQSLVQAARLMPVGAHRPQQSPVAIASSTTDTAASSSTSQDMLQEFMAPPRPYAATIAGKPEIAVVAAKHRRATIQVQGSVPSPGIGHH
uniref:Uncharacterized protein n=1 Tax=Leersia perrieri TaxID=77586 RepID=A0A0D9WDS6_9ORYZ